MKRLNLHIAPFLLCVLLMPPLAGCARRTAVDDIAQGDSLLNAGNPKAALRCFKRAARRVTDSAPLYYGLGCAYFAVGNLGGAAEAFESALKIAPDTPLALEYLAQVHLQRQQWSVAGELLTRALKGADAADQPRILNALALCEGHLGRDSVAALRLQQAMRLDRRHAPSYYNYASMLRDQFKLFEAAIDYFELYLRLAPPDEAHIAKARDSIARLKLAGAGGGMPRRENPDARAAAAAASAFAEGETHRLAQRWPRAVSSYQRALLADPRHYAAAFNLGLALSSSGKRKEAAKAFQDAAAIEPNKVEPLFSQAIELYQLGEHDMTIRLLGRHLLPRWPDNSGALRLYSLASAAKGRYGEARIFGEAYISLASEAAKKENFAAWLKGLPAKDSSKGG